MKKTLFIIPILLITILVLIRVDESKIYTFSKKEWPDDSLVLPVFIKKADYSYQREDTPENSTIHRFIINKSSFESEDFYMVMPEIKPGHMDLNNIIKLLGLPTTVSIYEDQGYFFLNLNYNEIHLFFGPIGETLLEIRFESETPYKFRDKISVGTPLSIVLENFPVEREVLEKDIDWEQGSTLFRNVGGRSGRHYIDYPSMGLRLFFLDNRIHTLYLY